MSENSVFSNSKKTTVMYLEPILNSYYKTYHDVITLSNIPDGPISEMVSTMSSPKLSEFQTASPFYGSPGFGRNPFSNCMHVLMKYPVGKGIVANGYSAFIRNTDSVTTSDDIPSIFSYLMENGYTVDTQLTRMIQTSEVNIGGSAVNRFSGKRKMICFFTYSGNVV